MKIILSKHDKSLGVRRRLLEKCARSALRLAQRMGVKKPGRTAIELQLVKSVTIRKLNLKYRRKDKATDVLSFDSVQPDLLGSIVIDTQTAARQAKEFNHSLEREILELFVHGVFHLLGFDHEKPRDAKIMKNLEQQMEKKISLWLR